MWLQVDRCSADSANKPSKGKKKAPTLDAVQSAVLRAATNALKFLTVLPQGAYTVAHLRCLPVLVGLLESPSLTIRRNCHVIVGVRAAAMQCHQMPSLLGRWVGVFGD